MKINCEISNLEDAERAMLLLRHYLASFRAAKDVDNMLLNEKKRLAPKDNGNRPGWSPERRAKFMASMAKRKRKAAKS